MGHDQVQKPRLGLRGRVTVSAPQNEGRQQTLGPEPQFDMARSEDRGLSDAVSLPGETGRALSFGYVRSRDPDVSTSLRPFAPPTLLGFNATMGALTPARRLVVSLSGTMNTAWTRAGLSALCAWPSDHSASNHPLGPPIAFTRYRSAWEAVGSHRFGLRLLPAGSPHEQAESSSLALRTGHSPPVASHPASRRRSFLWLQVGERRPEEDFHLSDLAHSQTH
jgi:hypothetical protein